MIMMEPRRREGAKENAKGNAKRDGREKTRKSQKYCAEADAFSSPLKEEFSSSRLPSPLRVFAALPLRIDKMPRRIHVPQLHPGEITLTSEQAHHARKVLRLEDGAAVEIFDDTGRVAAGVLLHRGTSEAAVRIESAILEPRRKFLLTIAAAVPKGERADWMVEKLSELGVETFMPLAAARSVVLPRGRNKQERWERIALESAKQSRRSGTMRIAPLTPVAAALKELAGNGWVLSTADDAQPIALATRSPLSSLTAFIGPEGGWTAEELVAFSQAGVVPVRLTDTVLRVETAAIAAAGIVQILTNAEGR
jgi:16S rRNA (uracil1498-N3)-methyltransferase